MGLCTDNSGKKSTTSNVSEMENESVNCICTMNCSVLFSGAYYLGGRLGGKASANRDTQGTSRWGKRNKPSP